MAILASLSFAGYREQVMEQTPGFKTYLNAKDYEPARLARVEEKIYLLGKFLRAEGNDTTDLGYNVPQRLKLISAYQKAGIASSDVAARAIIEHQLDRPAAAFLDTVSPSVQDAQLFRKYMTETSPKLPGLKAFMEGDESDVVKLARAEEQFYLMAKYLRAEGNDTYALGGNTLQKPRIESAYQNAGLATDKDAAKAAVARLDETADRFLAAAFTQKGQRR